MFGEEWNGVYDERRGTNDEMIEDGNDLVYSWAFNIGYTLTNHVLAGWLVGRVRDMTKMRGTGAV